MSDIMYEIVKSNTVGYNIQHIKMYKEIYTVEQLKELISSYIDNGKFSFLYSNSYHPKFYKRLCEISFDLFFFIIQKLKNKINLSWNPSKDPSSKLKSPSHILLDIIDTVNFDIDNYIKLYRYLKDIGMYNPDDVFHEYFLFSPTSSPLIIMLISDCCEKKLSVIKFLFSEEKDIHSVFIYESIEKFLIVNYNNFRPSENKNYWQLKLIEMLIELNIFDVEKEFLLDNDEEELVGDDEDLLDDQQDPN